jgi:collagenase-like PrtC family protease
MNSPVFSVPFNGDLALVKSALASGKVSEVYFSPWSRHLRAANYFGASEKAAAGADTFKKLYKLCRASGARVNLLCNSPVLRFGGLPSLFSKIRALGVPDAITLADPLAVRPFKAAFPDTELQASFIMNLDSPSKIARALALGLGAVTLPAALNRDARALEALRQLKRRFPSFRVKIMANMDCFAGCVFVHSHYTHGALLAEGGEIEDEENGPARLCHMEYGSPADFIRVPFIRPEDAAFYARRGWCDEFKLIYRAFPSSVLRQVYRAYFSGRHAGNLFEIVPSKNAAYENARGGGRGPALYCDNSAFPRGFAAKACACSKDCGSCGYCGKIAERTKCRVN